MSGLELSVSQASRLCELAKSDDADACHLYYLTHEGCV